MRISRSETQWIIRFSGVTPTFDRAMLGWTNVHLTLFWRRFNVHLTLVALFSGWSTFVLIIIGCWFCYHRQEREIATSCWTNDCIYNFRLFLEWDIFMVLFDICSIDSDNLICAFIPLCCYTFCNSFKISYAIVIHAHNNYMLYRSYCEILSDNQFINLKCEFTNIIICV